MNQYNIERTNYYKIRGIYILSKLLDDDIDINFDFKNSTYRIDKDRRGRNIMVKSIICHDFSYRGRNEKIIYSRFYHFSSKDKLFMITSRSCYYYSSLAREIIVRKSRYLLVNSKTRNKILFTRKFHVYSK